MVLGAKCPKCGEKAKVDDDMSKVTCEHCGFCVQYEKYLEIMKERAVGITDEFQASWDRRPF